VRSHARAADGGALDSPRAQFGNAIRVSDLFVPKQPEGEPVLRVAAGRR
jgi:hypothetical protein